MINILYAFYSVFVLAVLIVGATAFMIGITWSHGVPIIKKRKIRERITTTYERRRGSSFPCTGVIHMKSKYLVYQTKWVDEDGTPFLKYIKTFRHEPEAMTYINSHDDEDLYLDREDSDGQRYWWDADSMSWQKIDELEN